MANLSTMDVPAVGRRNILRLETWIMLIGGVIAAFVAYWLGQAGALKLRDTVMQQVAPRQQPAAKSNNNGTGSVVMFQ